MPPALQSVNVALTVANSVGGGSGTPTAGNWLVVLAGLNEQYAASGFTIGVRDDLHSYWRPAKVSPAAGLTRTSCWYTANTIGAAGTVYIHPNGALDAMAVLVLELAGAGPWDTLTVTPASNYAAAATSLSLSLGAPSASSFAIAAVTGDSTAAGQAFAPGGWTALHTVSATNGVDHTCDCVLTSAFLASNSGSLSVSASASGATDLSGVIVELAVTGSSPVPGGSNPNWPYMLPEAAFGSGFGSPEDSMTWTSLGDITNNGIYRRWWGWNDNSGVPYALGQLQSSTGSVQLDNADGKISPLNPASLHYTSAAGWSPLAAFYDPLITAQAPAAWWKLADASGSGTAADSSGNGHAGTATSVTFGNASEAVSGDTSAAFASGSTSHITTAYNPALSGGVTAECWVNLNSLSQSGNPALLANSNTASDHKGFALGLTGTTPQVTFGNGTTSAAVTASAALPATGWTYLAGTWDGTTVTLYVNGVSQGTAALSGSMPAGSNNIGIGYNPTTSSGYLNGLLAEAAVYGTALTSQQIAGHYTAGPAGTGTPVRVRMAIGTIGGVTHNRWYIWQRNGLAWPERRNKALRGYVEATTTDAWSVAGASCPTPYRGEIEQEASLYGWWPCDDQALAGGVLPSSLRNAAPGNTNVLNITLSPNAALETWYSTSGSATYVTPIPGVAATYAVAANAGWMYGDPQSSPASYATSNPVTSSPGSAAWQQQQQAGNDGGEGWWLSCNDSGFPPLSGGATVEAWFNYDFWASSNVVNVSGTGNRSELTQPYANISILALYTASLPVAILQLDNTTGHLNLITYNGSTPTTNSIYTGSDLRSETFHHVAVTLTTTTWTVYLDGGITAKVSGTATGMTSAWSWLLANGDTGVNGGGNSSTIARGGNGNLSHIKVYSAQLPAWRILAHYCAAATAFGVIPAPQGVTVTFGNGNLSTNNNGASYASDGSVDGGSYTTSPAANTSMSARVAAVIGSYTSGPSAWVIASNRGQYAFAWVNWTGLAPLWNVYTASTVGSETEASTVAGALDSYTSGYGGSAAGAGRCHVGSGSGASPPAAASSLGDTVAERLERILGYGQMAPARAIDATANLLVQAATDVGGQQAGASIQAIVDSDNGLLFVDSTNALCYWSRTHLAASPVVWQIGMNTIAGMIPFDATIEWSSDPQRIWDAITCTPFSPDGASLASYTPASATAADAAQAQFGVRPKQVTSYLQDPAKIQAQATWLQGTFGLLQRRASIIAVDAATYPAAWGILAAGNPGDIARIFDSPLGQPATTGVYRISQLTRSVSYGANGLPVQAKLVLVLDPLPASYWQ